MLVLVLQDDEYVVYSPDQVKLKFVVQYSVEGDAPKEFSPNINICAEPSTDRDEKITEKPDNGILLLRSSTLNV